MKKTISLILAFLFIFTSAFPIFATEQTTSNVDLKKSIEIAKQKLNISTDGFDFESSYSENRDRKKLWSLNWHSKDKSKKSINVTVDADSSDVIYYNTYSTSVNTSKIPKFSNDQALKAATDFANKLQSEKFKATKLMDKQFDTMRDYTYYSDSYTFTFIRDINGIPYIDNNILINVDKNTLEITNYSLDWDDKLVPDKKEAMSIEDAKKVFKENLGIEPSYQLVYQDSYDDPKAILVYTYKNGNKPIDAISKEIVNYNNYYPMRSKEMKNEKVKGDVITPEEQKAIEDTSKLISKEKAIEFAKQYLEIDNYTLTNANLNKGYPKGSNPSWSLNWEFRDNNKETYEYKNCSVDAVTGQINDFYQGGSEFEPQTDLTPKYTRDSAKQLAVEFLKKIQSNKFNSTEYRHIESDYSIKEEKPTNYYYTFIRKVNDIACPFNTLNVSINAYTGQIVSFNMSWFDIDLPKSDNIISLEDAYTKLFDKMNFSLKYIRNTNLEESSAKPTEIKLVYMLDTTSNFIDAKTGNLLDYNGNPIKEQTKVSFTDIKGHWAEKDISTLLELGIIQEDSQTFCPKDNIKQKDFIKMLVNTFGPVYKFPVIPDDKNDSFYEEAINRKIIFPKEKSPKKFITRLEASKYLVRALNVAYIADLNGIYSPKFKDLKEKNNRDLGYISIISGLNILNGNNGYFGPDKNISRADTAVILIRFLKININNNE